MLFETLAQVMVQINQSTTRGDSNHVTFRFVASTTASMSPPIPNNAAAISTSVVLLAVAVLYSSSGAPAARASNTLSPVGRGFGYINSQPFAVKRSGSPVIRLIRTGI